MRREKTLVGVLDQITRGSTESLARSVPELSRLRSMIDKRNFVGMGIAEKVTASKATDQLCLVVYVERKLALRSVPTDSRVPREIPSARGGPLLTDVVQLGKLRLDAGPAATAKGFWPGGSIGHRRASAGTIGAVVTRGGKYEILSNCHVLALNGKAKKGDEILMPGREDGGKFPRDYVAHLTKFARLTTGGAFVNKVDCACARVLSERLDELRAAIPGLGPPKGTKKPQRGMRIVKVGRTSGKTTGTVRDIHFRVVFPYDEIGDVGFLDQVLCTRYSSPGDSGSLVLDRETKRAVGLHFAGAPEGSVFCPIDAVLDALDAKLVTKEL